MYRLQDEIQQPRTQDPGKSYANEPKPVGTCREAGHTRGRFWEASDLGRFGEAPLQLEWRFRVWAEFYFPCPAGRGCDAVLPSVIPSTHLMASKYIVRMSGSCHDSSVCPRVE